MSQSDLSAPNKGLLARGLKLLGQLTHPQTRTGKVFTRAEQGLTRVLAVELMTAARALNLGVSTGSTAGTTPSPATGAVVGLLRDHGVGGPGTDRFLAPEIESAYQLVLSRRVTAAVTDVIGELQ